MPNLVEVTFGGYSAFKIDKNGTITDISQMSDLNRTKIINLLEKPLKFLPYVERLCSGIDVVLESQVKGIEQIPEYYKTKYGVSAKEIIQVNVANIDEFIEDVKPVMENVSI